MVFVLFSPLNAHKLPQINETPKTERCQKSDSESTAGFVLSQFTTKCKELSHALLALLRDSQYTAPKQHS